MPVVSIGYGTVSHFKGRIQIEDKLLRRIFEPFNNQAYCRSDRVEDDETRDVFRSQREYTNCETNINVWPPSILGVLQQIRISLGYGLF